MPSLFIISGCNGAGKTTASYTVLPDLLQVKEFVNADEIARGLSPFQPEKAAFEAGRIMLRRLDELLARGKDFAFETTLASRSFVGLVRRAKDCGYSVTLIYYWLDSVELAIERVKARVAEGGHHIPADTIIRRYYSGLRNFLTLYRDKVDYWLLIDNSSVKPEVIAEGNIERTEQIQQADKWSIIQNWLQMTQSEIRANILKGGKLAIERMLDRKRRDNAPVVISYQGKVMKVNAKDLKP